MYACWSDGSGGAPKPTEEPVEMCHITCHRCVYSINGISYASGMVPKGTEVLIIARSASFLGWFDATPYNVSRGSYSDPMRGMYNKTGEEYVFSYRQVITEDTDISFIGIA